MFEIIFGSIWTIIVTIFAILSNSKWGTQEGISLGVADAVIGIFWLIGIVILVKGIRKVIIDRRTDSKGEECYGKVCDIYPSGKSVNDRPIYKADFLVYIPSESRTDTISEEIGMNYNKYPVGSYVKVKYYDGDINIEESVDINYIPQVERQMLGENEVLTTDGRQSVIIDGVEYVRKDSIN